ncbi:MAG: 3-methyl-2-oxobutanoate dehydrogenase subunit VorB [Oscillospiraceae bacterium]|nr:3-methyl-2-oxobutanoate dehydrogenase subunit VorB [Oscillospiraceae bacterium]
MEERILMKGNEALAEAAIQAGCIRFFGYPITPQTEVAAYMSKRLPKIGGTYLQAESEVAAVNMLQGAGAAGARAMTSSSSPGISLKTEGISYMAGADIPGLIINVQRGGPGLGGIQPSQADYWQATKAPGHGDLHIIVFAPSSVQEMVDLVENAFDLSDEYRIPAMILADGLLGQMMEPVTIKKSEGGKKLPEKKWAAKGHGHKRAHNIINSLYLKAADLERVINERFERYKELEVKHTRCERYMTDDADVVVVAYGATGRIAKAAVKAAREQGVKAGLFRPITLWPFPKQDLKDIAKSAKAFLTVEMSMGQMVDDVKLAIDCKRPVDFFGHTGGIVPTPQEVLDKILKLAGGER